jgi:hypothetical protein
MRTSVPLVRFFGLITSLALTVLVTVTAPMTGESALAQAPPITLDEYWQRVAETQAQVGQLTDPPSAAAVARLHALATRWQALTVVTLPDGTLIPVDQSVLVALLRADPPDRARLEDYLQTLLAAQEEWPEAQFTAAARTALTEILARPEFQYREQTTPGWLQWLVDLWRRLLQWLDQFAPSSDGVEQPGGWLEQVGTLLLLLVLAGLVAYALKGILADFAAESVLTAEVDRAEEPLTAEAALRRAQQLSGGGDYRTAVRFLYLATLLHLEERGLLRYDRSLTNREVLSRVAHDPNLTAVLRDVVEVFDRVWYGYQPLDAPAYRRYAAAVEDLKRL